MDLELDDDVFFADISKQISLLIMDGDEQLNPVSLSASSSLSFQDMFRGGYQIAPYMYQQEHSKGTGVFIPKSAQPRRRPHHHHQKQGRFSSFNAKQQHSLHQNRQQAYEKNHENTKNTLTTHNISNNNNKSNMNSIVHSSIPRRTYRDSSYIYT